MRLIIYLGQLKHRIEVSGIRIYAFHGCLEEEAKIGGEYIVDVEIMTDFSRATSSDDLVDTIDYVHVNQIVKSEMAIRSKLIEHVGQRILSKLKTEIDHKAEYKVIIKKITPPINGNVDYVSISIGTKDF